MTRPRLIPVMLLKHGLLVRSQEFKTHQVIGNPMSTISRLSNWNVDELILLDISEQDFHDLRRDDLQQQYAGNSALDVLREVARVCLVPMAFGGRIQTLNDIASRLDAGADKVVINTQALSKPSFISEAALRFGSQCIVVNIDAKLQPDGGWRVYSRGGTQEESWTPSDWAQEVEKLGAGEIFLNSIDRDGMANGYDLPLVRAVTSCVSLPVIACGGVGRFEDFAPAIQEGNASAAAAANIFHFRELSYPIAKRTCSQAGVAVRDPGAVSKWAPREPVYTSEEKRLRLDRWNALLDVGKYQKGLGNNARWCSNCLYPSMSAVPLEFDEKGGCTGCLMSTAKRAIPKSEWQRRKSLLVDLIEQYRSKDQSNYDCVIPVSGGKDSYFQTHYIVNELGLKPLLVTYNGNNWTEEGWHNVHRMKEVFGVDHLFFSPGVELLKKLNRLAFLVMGDMNWHSHVGIMSLPMRVAVQNKIPLVFYGEHGYLDLGGQFSMTDFPEVTYRTRLEHFSRGFDWNYFVGLEGITAQDMMAYRYPSDQEIFDLDLRGIYLGNYVYWEANEHGKMVQEKYGFRGSEQEFDRTYRRLSNLDDMHENGAHDYLKFIKFGYGRCADHVAKDIRAGLMDQNTGRGLILKYDHVKPRDLLRWYEYAGVTESDFDRVADTFRDPRVWKIKDGHWAKIDVDGIERIYGEVAL